MPWSPDYLDDGQDATAASVNSKFTSAQTWLEAITDAGVRRAALGKAHAPKLMRPEGLGYTIVGDDDVHSYTEAVFGASITYNAYGNNGGSATVGDLGTGDRAIVGHPSQTGPYIGPAARLNLNSPDGIRVGMDNGDKVAAILCMFNCEVYKADMNAEPDPPNGAIMFCLQFRLNATGTWFTIRRTERFVAVRDHQTSGGTSSLQSLNIDVPITTLLNPVVVASVGGVPGDAVTNIRAMVSSVNFDPLSSFRLNRWRLTAIPLFAEDNG